MSQDINPQVVKLKRSLLQRLESMERAGVTHLKKLPVIKAKIPPAATPPRSHIASQAVTPPPARPKPSPVPPPAVPLKTVLRQDAQSLAKKPEKKLPSLEKIELLEQSTDPRCQALALVARDVAGCRRCKELAETRTQTVFGVGNPYAKLAFCGEAPGADEDRLGEPFVGRAGQLLTDIIEKGMKIRREDVYILNILRCRPPGNRNPLPLEAANCREYLERQLQIVQPEYICCLGAVAAQNLLQNDAPIGRLRGIRHVHSSIRSNGM